MLMKVDMLVKSKIAFLDILATVVIYVVVFFYWGKFLHRNPQASSMINVYIVVFARCICKQTGFYAIFE